MGAGSFLGLVRNELEDGPEEFLHRHNDRDPLAAKTVRVQARSKVMVWKKVVLLTLSGGRCPPVAPSKLSKRDSPLR